MIFVTVDFSMNTFEQVTKIGSKQCAFNNTLNSTLGENRFHKHFENSDFFAF